MHGEVLAIHMSIGPEVVHNFHVPVTEIRLVWDKMLAGEVWGGETLDQEKSSGRVVLGLAGRTVNNRPLVTQVFTGLPADAAGVKPGDQIISVDGQPLESMLELSNYVFAKQPGTSLHLELLRDARTLQLDIILTTVRDPLPGSLPPPAAESNSDDQEQS